MAKFGSEHGFELLPSAESGRTTPIRGSYRPNHNFSSAENRVMGVGYLNFGEGKKLSPGESVEMEMTFWSRPKLNEVVVPGRKWRIQEGDRLVGIGELLSILD